MGEELLYSEESVALPFGEDYREVEVGRMIRVCQDVPLKLDSGAELSDIPVAFQHWGELNADKSNVILICHALTGDQYVIGQHPVTGKPGWWEVMVGPGKPVDTDRYFVICMNVLGSCMGTYGPKSTNPATGKVWATDFPVVTIPDMVRLQAIHAGCAGDW